jgi:hypothetical protein
VKRALVVLAVSAVVLLAYAMFVVVEFVGTCYGWWDTGNC